MKTTRPKRPDSAGRRSRRSSSGERVIMRYSFLSDLSGLSCPAAFFFVLSSCTRSNAVAVASTSSLVGVRAVRVLERQPGEEDETRAGLHPLEEVGQALQVGLANLEVGVVLDIPASGRDGGALARLGDLNVLGARGRLQIARQLRRRVADARLLDRVARLGVEVLVAVLGDGRQRVADGGVPLLQIADVAELVDDEERDGHGRHRRGEHRDPALLAGAEPLPLAHEEGGRAAGEPRHRFTKVAEHAHGRLSLTDTWR